MVNTKHTGLAGWLEGPEQISVERGLAEFRCGRPVIITDGDAIVALPIDGMDDDRLASFRRLAGAARPYLVVTARRAQALGVSAQ